METFFHILDTLAMCCGLTLTMETVNDTNVETAARVEQIRGKNCDAGLIAKGIDRSSIRHYGFAFRGREVLIAGR